MTSPRRRTDAPRPAPEKGPRGLEDTPAALLGMPGGRGRTGSPDPEVIGLLVQEVLGRAGTALKTRPPAVE